MKIFSFLLIYLIFLIFGLVTSRNLREEELEISSVDDTIKYSRISVEKLKNYLLDNNTYVIDTRDLKKSAAGYIPNTILIPTNMYSYVYSLVPVGSNVIIITEIEDKQTSIEDFIELYSYKFLGYCIFSEINKNNNFELQVVEYNPNLNENIQEIVDKGETIIDIRENSEHMKTGYIEQAKLIPLSKFLEDFDTIPSSGNVFILCKSGIRSIIAMTFLKREGFTNRLVVMKGGMNRVIEEGYPLIKSK